MNKIAFYGSIWSGNYKVVAAVLGKWTKTEDLNIKIRLGGEEIIYEDEQIYLYCYNAVTNEVTPSSFLLEGNISRTLDEAKLLLKQLLELCKAHQIVGSFEYVEVTEYGDEVSNEFYIKE
jgi:hypothetical protein